MFCQRCGGATATAIVEDRERPVCTQCGWVTYLDPKLAVERYGVLAWHSDGGRVASDHFPVVADLDPCGG